MECALLHHFVDDLAPHVAFTIIACPTFGDKVITERIREATEWLAETWGLEGTHLETSWSTGHR